MRATQLGGILPIEEKNDDLVYINEHVCLSKQLLSEIANQLKNKNLAFTAQKFYLEKCAIAKISRDLFLTIEQVNMNLKKIRIILLSSVYKIAMTNRTWPTND